MLYNSYVILFQTFVFVLTVSDEENIPLMILHRPGSVIKSTSGVMLVSVQFAFLKVSASVVVCRLCLPSAGDQDYLRWMKSSAKLDVTATFTIGLAKRCYRWTSEPRKCSVYDLIVSETVARWHWNSVMNNWNCSLIRWNFIDFMIEYTTFII